MHVRMKVGNEGTQYKSKNTYHDMFHRKQRVLFQDIIPEQNDLENEFLNEIFLMPISTHHVFQVMQSIF